MGSQPRFPGWLLSSCWDPLGTRSDTGHRHWKGALGCSGFCSPHQVWARGSWRHWDATASSSQSWLHVKGVPGWSLAIPWVTLWKRWKLWVSCGSYPSISPFVWPWLAP